MWGIEFEEARNSLIVITATFTIKHRNKRDETFRFADGPHGGWLDVFDPNAPEGKEWNRITWGNNVRQEVEQRFPDEYGFSWTWETFLVALTFWGEGKQRGFYQGEDSVRQQ